MGCPVCLSLGGTSPSAHLRMEARSQSLCCWRQISLATSSAEVSHGTIMQASSMSTSRPSTNTSRTRRRSEFVQYLKFLGSLTVLVSFFSLLKPSLGSFARLARNALALPESNVQLLICGFAQVVAHMPLNLSIARSFSCDDRAE